MPSQEPIHLFVYGTLTDPECVKTLTGKEFERVDAVLRGFERLNSPLGYPFIVPNPSGALRGVLLLNIDPVSLAYLDSYESEGELYQRQVVVVEVADTPATAMTYVGRDIQASITPTPGRWTDPNQAQGLSDVTAPPTSVRPPDW
jgi:gamma-glutamylcyclotransferase (GGCT)/AIG2-like uncharacterized protein YtfP